jgi:hypothetical protein
VRRRRYEVTEMYALIDISNQMLEDSAFDPAGASLRKAGLAVAINEMRVLSKQWRVESCPCSIDVIGGKQRDRHVDHGNGFRDHAGAPSKAGEPMAQPTVDALNCSGLVLADIMPPHWQERVVRPILVCTVQLDTPGFQPLQQPGQRGGITIAAFPVKESLASAIKSQPDPELVLFFLMKCQSSSSSITTTSSPGSGCGRDAWLVAWARSQFRIDGVETPNNFPIAFMDKPNVYSSTAVSFFQAGSPRGGLKLVCRPQSLHRHFGTP